jgi:type IV pilus assembly protein PilW
MKNFNNKQQGLSIVELMIAVLTSSVVLLGIISVFDTSSNLSRTQNGLARLQENGRFATMHMKQNIEQAGFQNCISTSVSGDFLNQSPQKIPWLIYAQNDISGIPNRTDVSMSTSPAAGAPYLFDPAFMIRGHECDANSCLPAVDSVGSDTSFVIPEIGINDGDRIAGTDVLSFRYIQNNGREVQTIVNAGNVATISFTANDIANTTIPPIYGDQLLVANCDESNVAPVLVDVINSQLGQVTVSTPVGQTLAGGGASFSRVFGIDNDIKHMTYFVANKKAGDRDVPTLYHSSNGNVTPLVEGVDRFDVVYGIQMADGTYRYLNASQVEALPVTSCFRVPTGAPQANGTLTNTPGCGWRSVVSVEIHLLMNTRNNSTTKSDEPFFYSLNGNASETPSDLASSINHYKMMRKEFVTSIALKNN